MDVHEVRLKTMLPIQNKIKPLLLHNLRKLVLNLHKLLPHDWHVYGRLYNCVDMSAIVWRIYHGGDFPIQWILVQRAIDYILCKFSCTLADKDWGCWCSSLDPSVP